jgi:hypothetical protein
MPANQDGNPNKAGISLALKKNSVEQCSPKEIRLFKLATIPIKSRNHYLQIR